METFLFCHPLSLTIQIYLFSKKRVSTQTLHAHPFFAYSFLKNGSQTRSHPSISAQSAKTRLDLFRKPSVVPPNSSPPLFSIVFYSSGCAEKSKPAKRLFSIEMFRYFSLLILPNLAPLKIRLPSSLHHQVSLFSSPENGLSPKIRLDFVQPTR